MNIKFEYVVKFVQGKVTPNDVSAPVAPGEYWTAINVYNPNPFPIQLDKKVVIAKPEDEMPRGDVFGPKSPILESERALEIDREDITSLVNSNEGFLKGFVVIQSKSELDVVAVYTVADENRQIKALHTERVLPRRLERPEI